MNIKKLFTPRKLYISNHSQSISIFPLKKLPKFPCLQGRKEVGEQTANSKEAALPLLERWHKCATDIFIFRNKYMGINIKE